MCPFERLQARGHDGRLTRRPVDDAPPVRPLSATLPAALLLSFQTSRVCAIQPMQCTLFANPLPAHPPHHQPQTYQDGRAAKGMNADAGDATRMAAQATTTEVIFPIACSVGMGNGRVGCGENWNGGIKPTSRLISAGLDACLHRRVCVAVWWGRFDRGEKAGRLMTTRCPLLSREFKCLYKQL